MQDLKICQNGMMICSTHLKASYCEQECAHSCLSTDDGQEDMSYTSTPTPGTPRQGTPSQVGIEECVRIQYPVRNSFIHYPTSNALPLQRSSSAPGCLGFSQEDTAHTHKSAHVAVDCDCAEKDPAMLLRKAARFEARAQRFRQRSMLVKAQECQTTPLGYQRSPVARRMWGPTVAQVHSEKEEPKTTVMLRNIPNNYTRDKLLALLETEGFLRDCDFVYLPFDFKTKANVGYAFVNFVSHEDAICFMEHFQGFFDWSGNTSTKVAQVNWGDAHHQGRVACNERYRKMMLNCNVPECFKPIFLSRGRPIA
jgi:hypothetical protein